MVCLSSSRSSAAVKVLVINQGSFNLGFYMMMPFLAQHMGSGLGLAISHNIILAHHGHIHAEPSPLGGLRVVVTLPESA